MAVLDRQKSALDVGAMEQAEGGQVAVARTIISKVEKTGWIS